MITSENLQQAAWSLARFLANLTLNIALGVAMFMALWYGLASYLEKLPEEDLANEEIQYIVPYPEDVWDVWQDEEVQETVEIHLEASTERVLRGIIYATALAWPIGVLLGQSRFFNRLFSPVLGLIYPIPKVVFLPVIIVLYGIEDESKIVLIAIVVFFQILVVVRDEALNVPRELVESVRSLGAGRRALYWYVYLPSSFGAVLTGWRVSVGTAVAVLFIAETTAGNLGLGYYITNSWFRLRYPQMYIGILAMSLLGIVLYLATDVLERLFRRWKYV